MAKKSTKSKKPKQPKAAKQPAKEAEYKMLSLDLIDDPAQPMRANMTEASVEELVLSIKQVGLIEPIVVKPVNGRYEVIAGHRRTYACRLAKLLIVPCHIRVANKEQTEMLKIHENLYRADIKPAEEAKHFAYLIDKQKMSPVKIAQLISKSPGYVMDRLAILDYPDFLKEPLDKGQISFSVAREFARFDDLQQMRAAVYYAKRGGMTHEMAKKWVQDHKRSLEAPAIQETTQPGVNGEPEEIVHTATCIYCKQGLRLIDAAVVYMHDKCQREVNEPVVAIEPQSPDDPLSHDEARSPESES